MSATQEALAPLVILNSPPADLMLGVQSIELQMMDLNTLAALGVVSLADIEASRRELWEEEVRVFEEYAMIEARRQGDL